MKRQFQKQPNLPFFLSHSSSLRLFTFIVSYLSKQQNIRTLPPNPLATRMDTGFALFRGYRTLLLN